MLLVRHQNSTLVSDCFNKNVWHSGLKHMLSKFEGYLCVCINLFVFLTNRLRVIHSITLSQCTGERCQAQ